jgi:hypothetical protein
MIRIRGFCHAISSLTNGVKEIGSDIDIPGLFNQARSNEWEWE